MKLFACVPYGVKETIVDSMVASVGISPLGAIIPILDTAAITGIWGNMLYKIAKYHHVSMTNSECAKIITACGSSVLGYLGGSKGLSFLLNFIPGLGTLGAMAGNIIFNGYYTYAIGKAFHEMLNDYDINSKTIKEIAGILIHLFVPVPSLSDLKEIYVLMKDNLT